MKLRLQSFRKLAASVLLGSTIATVASAKVTELPKPLVSHVSGDLVVSAYAYVGPTISQLHANASRSGRQTAADVIAAIPLSCGVVCTPAGEAKFRNKVHFLRTYLSLQRVDGARFDMDWRRAKPLLEAFCARTGHKPVVTNRATHAGNGVYYAGACE